MEKVAMLLVCLVMFACVDDVFAKRDVDDAVDWAKDQRKLENILIHAMVSVNKQYF